MNGATRLNVEEARKWVAALRSGRYEKAVGCLHNERGQFCNLGVYADVCGVKWEQITQHEIGYKDGPVAYISTLSPSIMQKLKAQAPQCTSFTHGSPVLLVAPGVKELSRLAIDAIALNDVALLTFEQIADCIEYTIAEQEKEDEAAYARGVFEDGPISPLAVREV